MLEALAKAEEAQKAAQAAIDNANVDINFAKDDLTQVGKYSFPSNISFINFGFDSNVVARLAHDVLSISRTQVGSVL